MDPDPLHMIEMADLVVLDKDPSTVDPDTIKDIRVMETWLDGIQVYRA
jgi:predicted amidohydrolase YtcJ